MYNNIILEMICKDRVGFKDLERLYQGHIEHDSIICTDSHKSYIRFGRNLNLDRKRIMRNHYKNGIYHIYHVNNLHSQFKKWMDKFTPKKLSGHTLRASLLIVKYRF